MKKLIDITDEDVLKVINRIHIIYYIYPLTENKVISRNGLHGLSFEESFRKYGSCYIEVEMISHDIVTDGHFTFESKCRLQFHHKSVWFAEYDSRGNCSNYNKNHFFGYLKLQELGYELPDKPQW